MRVVAKRSDARTVTESVGSLPKMLTVSDAS